MLTKESFLKVFPKIIFAMPSFSIGIKFAVLDQVIAEWLGAEL